MHISEGVGKSILRNTALEAGFEKKFTESKKLAAQYGSGFKRIIASAIKSLSDLCINPARTASYEISITDDFGSARRTSEAASITSDSEKISIFKCFL